MSTTELIVLKPKRTKLFAMLCFSVALCLTGVWLIRQGIHAGWPMALFFGLGVVALPAVLATNHGCLTITPQGFTLHGAFRTDAYSWSDVEEFGVGSIYGNRMVVFNCRPDFSEMKRARAAAKAAVGFECAISDLYEVPTDELAKLLNDWKTRYAEGS